MSKNFVFIFKVFITISMLFLLQGCITRTLVIETNPVEAKVILDGDYVGDTPYSEKLRWSKKDVHTMIIEAKDYEKENLTLRYEDALSASDPWEKKFTLNPLIFRTDTKITSNINGATIIINGAVIGTTPLNHTFVFTRPNSKTPWEVYTINVEAKNYERQSRTLRYEDAVSTIEPWEQDFELFPLVINAEIDITANVDGATVTVDGTEVGKTPLRHNFVFNRPSSKSAWSTHLIVVSKDGYRYKPRDEVLPAGENPPFSCSLTVESPYISSKHIELQSFEAIRFVRTKVRKPFFSSEGLEIEEEIVLSQVGEIEREPQVQSVTKITDAKPSDAFMETRIAVMPDSERIIYSFPFIRLGYKTDFLNMWLRRGSEQTRLTDAEKLDLEATATLDGKWIYFSSNRLSNSRYNIWRMQTEGRGGLTKITDSPSSRIDTEPAVSPDGQKLAYTCYLEGVEQSHIWVSNSDGTLPTQLRVGKSPCWSPDNQKLLYVAKDAAGHDRIWVMKADGSNPTQLTAGEYEDRFPVWTPDGERIVYSSNQALHEDGLPNFDLWIMKADGSENTQLTINGSYDTRPIVSPNGKYIYFLSNRGAKIEGQQNLQIWRIELPDSNTVF